MDRRQFLRNVMLWSAGATTIVPRWVVKSQEPSPASVLSLGVSKDYGALVRKILEPLGGMKAFVKSGDKVVVKPNIGWDRTPEQAANTHPDVVKALVEEALLAGASQVSVFDRTCNDQRRCYMRSGIQPALESMKDKRVKCEFIDERKFVPVEIVRGKALNQWDFYKDALEADCYINVPIAKHHGLTSLTLGFKNHMGILGGNRGKIHQNIDQKIADLSTVMKTKLTVIDATRILLRNGPQGGNIEDVKVLDTLFASTDPVAADAYATTLFSMNPEQIGTTVAAHEFGLGQMNLDKIKIVRV